MQRTHNTLPEEIRTQSVKLLNQHLAAAIDLHAQMKQAHWNVRGPGFIAIHELFDKVSQDVENYSDMLAERAGGLGGTYGGNPVACAAALGAIATMEELDLIGAARTIESVMVPRLRALAERTGVIGEVRGRGAMIAVEIVKPGSTIPDAELTSAVAKACHAQGVVVLTAGTYGNVLRFLPPLSMPAHLLDEALTVLEEQFLALTAR